MLEKVLASVRKGGLRKHWPSIASTLEKHPEFGTDIVRFPPHQKQVLTRMVKAFLFKEHGIRDSSTKEHLGHALNPVLRDALIADELNRPFARRITRGGDVFRVDWLFDPAQPNFGCWWFQFYKGPAFQIIYAVDPSEQTPVKG
jgi:hypothetical protein